MNLAEQAVRRACDNLRRQAVEAAGSNPVEPAAAGQVQALAGVIGLLGLLLARDEAQFTALQRVLGELAATDTTPEPPRVLLTLAVMLARHAVEEADEPAGAIGTVYREAVEPAPTPPRQLAQAVCGASRLLLLAATWWDVGAAATAELGRAERWVALAQGADERQAVPHAAGSLAAGFDALAAVALADTQAPATEPAPADPGAEPSSLMAAFERGAALAVALAAERPSAT